MPHELSVSPGLPQCNASDALLVPDVMQDLAGIEEKIFSYLGKRDIRLQILVSLVLPGHFPRQASGLELLMLTVSRLTVETALSRRQIGT
jgi:hypothetical protein